MRSREASSLRRSKSYRADLAIAESLARSDASNAGWQRDLSVSYGKVGDVEVAQGQLAQALESYRAEFAINDRLAKSDPSNAGWQRELSVAYQNIGNVEVAQGDLAQALEVLSSGPRDRRASRQIRSGQRALAGRSFDGL